MGSLRNLLLWNASIRDPFLLAFVTMCMLSLAMMFMSRPRSYLPFVLLTAPLPKLFTIANYEITAANGVAAPGFSLVDIVLGAGIIAILLRRWTPPKNVESRRFGRAMMWWSASVICSVGIGLLLWPGLYRPIYSVYAIRYLLTLASYAVAAQYARIDYSEGMLQKLLHRLTVAGNATVLLGLSYYFIFGSSGQGTHGVDLAMGGQGVLLSRTFFWFFDYGNDMGFFATLVGILNIISLSDRRRMGLRLLAAVGLAGCVATDLLIGERADVLVLAVSVIYFIVETMKFRHRSVRVSIVFQFVCLISVIAIFAGTLSILAPDLIEKKFQHTVGENIDQETSIEVMTGAGVPANLANAVASLPIGDFAGRLSLNIAGLFYFFNHPAGVGFWGELFVAGFYSHHEVIKVAIEQGFPGIITFIGLLVALRRLLWSSKDLPGAAGRLNIVLRAISAGLFAALVMANTVLLDMKFMLVYWTLVGVWSVVPRGAVRRACPATTFYEQLPHGAGVRG